MHSNGRYDFKVYASKGRWYCAEICDFIGVEPGDSTIAIADDKADLVRQMERFVAEAQAALEKARALPDDPADWEWYPGATP